MKYHGYSHKRNIHFSYRSKCFGIDTARGTATTLSVFWRVHGWCFIVWRRNKIPFWAISHGFYVVFRQINGRYTCVVSPFRCGQTSASVACAYSTSFPVPFLTIFFSPQRFDVLGRLAGPCPPLRVVYAFSSLFPCCLPSLCFLVIAFSCIPYTKVTICLSIPNRVTAAAYVHVWWS